MSGGSSVTAPDFTEGAKLHERMVELPSEPLPHTPLEEVMHNLMPRMSSGGEKHWRLLDNLSGKTPTVNKSVESNKSLKRKRADGAAPRDRRGRARVFAPAASLSSNDRDLLVWLDAELRAGRVSVSSFCRRLSLVSFLFLGCAQFVLVVVA